MKRAWQSHRPTKNRASLDTLSKVRLDAPSIVPVRQDAPCVSYQSLLVLVRCLTMATLIFVTTDQPTSGQDFEAFEPPGLLPPRGLLPPPGAMTALAQEGQPEWQFGFQLFHLLLEQKWLYSVPDFRESMDRRPRQTAVVLMGDLNRVPTDLRSRLQKFLDSGGVVLVASDETSYFKSLFLISDGLFEVRNDESAYQGFRDCPVVNELRPGTSVLNGISSLVANRPGIISRMDDRFGNWSILARLPDLVDPRSRRRSQAALIAEWESRQRGGGRLLLMADHSVLINGMLWHGDNAKLAVNIADWLSTGDRKEVAFIVDGEPAKAILASQPELSDELPPLEELPTPTLEDLLKLPPDVLLSFANRFTAGMEDADVMNELLANQPADLPTSQYRQALYIVLGILAAIYTLRLMGKVGSRPPTRPPRAVGQSASFIPAPPLSPGALQAARQQLAQSALRQLTGSSDPQDWSIPVDDVEIDAGVIRRLFVREQLKRLKKMATDSNQTLTTPRDLKRLARLIASVVGLQKDGRLRHPSILT